MKKTFKILIVFMVVILSLSTISLIADTFTSGSTSGGFNPTFKPGDIIVVPGEDSGDVPGEDSGEDSGDVPGDSEEDPPFIDPGIVLPDEPTSSRLYNEVEFYGKGKDAANRLTLGSEMYPNYIVYSGESDFIFDKEYTNSFVSIALIDPCATGEIYTNGIDMSAYSYIKIEFDVLNDMLNLDEKSLLGCTIYPIGRYDVNSYAINQDNWIDVISSHNAGTFDVQCRSDDQIFNNSSHHIEYVIEIDHESTSKSRMQVFIDDILVYDSVGGTSFDADPEYLSEIRLNRFESVDSDSSIGFANLEISVYE